MADLQASPISDRNGALEEAFVDDYLRTQGHTREGVQCPSSRDREAHPDRSDPRRR